MSAELRGKIALLKIQHDGLAVKAKGKIEAAKKLLAAARITEIEQLELSAAAELLAEASELRERCVLLRKDITAGEAELNA